MDDAFNDIESRAGIILINPKGHKIHCALHFRFRASNNKVEYEALIARLCLAKELQARDIQIYSDSQLVVNQVNDIYLARGDRITVCLEKANGVMETFSITFIEVIMRSKTATADALEKLALTRDVKLLDVVSVEFLAKPNIKPQPEIMELTQEPSWMDPIIAYLKNGELLEEKTEAHILRLKAACYVLYNDKLYKRGLLDATSKMLTPYRGEEHHVGNQQGHMREPRWGQSLVFKALRPGYY